MQLQMLVGAFNCSVVLLLLRTLNFPEEIIIDGFLVIKSTVYCTLACA